MKLKMFSILAVVLFMSSSLSANPTSEANLEQIVEKPLCSTYAHWAATLIASEGGSYWSAYFASFAYCIGEEYGLNP